MQETIHIQITEYWGIFIHLLIQKENDNKSLSILDINKTPISQKKNITIDLFKVYQDIELSPQHQLLFNNYIHFCWYLKIPIL